MLTAFVAPLTVRLTLGVVFEGNTLINTEFVQLPVSLFALVPHLSVNHTEPGASPVTVNRRVKSPQLELQHRLRFKGVALATLGSLRTAFEPRIISPYKNPSKSRYLVSPTLTVNGT
jgi:hypothetical protein